MTLSREQRLRDVVSRVAFGGVSLEFSLLSVADSVFLFEQLDAARRDAAVLANVVAATGLDQIGRAP